MRARLVSLSKEGEQRLKQAVRILRKTDDEFRSDDEEVHQRLFDAHALR